RRRGQNTLAVAESQQLLSTRHHSLKLPGIFGARSIRAVLHARPCEASGGSVYIPENARIPLAVAPWGQTEQAGLQLGWVWGHGSSSEWYGNRAEVCLSLPHRRRPPSYDLPQRPIFVLYRDGAMKRKYEPLSHWEKTAG